MDWLHSLPCRDRFNAVRMNDFYNPWELGSSWQLQSSILTEAGNEWGSEPDPRSATCRLLGGGVYTGAREGPDPHHVLSASFKSQSPHYVWGLVVLTPHCANIPQREMHPKPCWSESRRVLSARLLYSVFSLVFCFMSNQATITSCAALYCRITNQATFNLEEEFIMQ